MMATMAAPVVAAVGTAMAATAMVTGLNAAAGLPQNLTGNDLTPNADEASENEPPAQEGNAPALPTGANDLA